MELTLDIFRNDAFSVVSLQRVVDNAPYVPQALGAMRLFDPKPIRTEDVLLFEKDGGFQLIPTTERGGPDIQQIRRQGRLRALSTVRLSKKDTVRAGELQGVADMALPETIRLRNAQQLTSDRTSQLRTDMEATKEFHRLGALRGQLYDADGATLLVDYFTEYGIAAPAVVNFDFATIAEGALAVYIQTNVRDPIIDVLEGRKTPQTKVAALVGSNFWYGLIQHVDVRKRWEAAELAQAIAMAANPLAQPPRYDTLEFGNVTFMHYQNSTGGEIAVDDDEAIFFPVGARDVFNVYWGPGETLLDAGDLGRPEFLYVQPDPRDQMPSYVDIVMRAYPLYACIFPKALMAGLRTG